MELGKDKKKEEQQINQNRYQAGNAPLSQPGMAEKLGNKVKNEAMNKGMELGKEQLASMIAPTATAAQTAGLQALAPVAGGLSPGASMAVMGNAGMAGTTGATLASGAGAAGAGAAGAGAMAALGPIGIGLAADELLGLGIRKKVIGFNQGGQVGPLNPQYNYGGGMAGLSMAGGRGGGYGGDGGLIDRNIVTPIKNIYNKYFPYEGEDLSYNGDLSDPRGKYSNSPAVAAAKARAKEMGIEIDPRAYETPEERYKSQGGPISAQYNAQGTMSEEQARALMNNQPEAMTEVAQEAMPMLQPRSINFPEAMTEVAQEAMPMLQPPRRRPMAEELFDEIKAEQNYVSSESLSPPGFSEEMARYMQAIGQPFGGRQ